MTTPDERETWPEELRERCADVCKECGNWVSRGWRKTVLWQASHFCAVCLWGTTPEANEEQR